MGSGTGTATMGTTGAQPMPPPPNMGDPLTALISSRRQALRSVAAKRGLQSTLMTGPQQSALGGVGAWGG